MNPSTHDRDRELLRSWTVQKSEAAFAELVRRHLGVVYSSALRQVHDPELARDVSQAVFLALARKAPALGGRVVISGWLFRATRFVALRALRAEFRRKHWETQAAAMNPTIDPSAATSSPSDAWLEVEPHLDAALADLPASDRDAVILRYLQHHPLRAVGERLGISEEAAKKRVSRAIDKLRALLGRRGVILSVVSLATLLAEVPERSVPADLPSLITRAAFAPPPPGIETLFRQAMSDLLRLHCLEFARAAFGVTALFLVVGGVFWLQFKNGLDPSPMPQAQAAVVPRPWLEPLKSSSETSPPANVPRLPGPSRIFLAVRAADDNRALPARILVQGFDLRNISLFKSNLTADAHGFAEIEADGSRLALLRVWASAPGYVPAMLTWKSHEFVEPVLNYTARLTPGGLLRGRVLNERHDPVSGAKISFSGPVVNMHERQIAGFHPDITDLVTDDQGRFQSDQIPVPFGSAHVYCSVEHPDYVRETLRLQTPQSLQTNHVVILKGGLFVRGRVVDALDSPIPSASVWENSRTFGPERSGKSDTTGAFELGPFAPGPLHLEASAPGLKRSENLIEVSPAATNVVFRLAEPDPTSFDSSGPWPVVRITGTVRDSQTQDAIPRFRVLLKEHNGNDAEFLGEGHAGFFEWPVSFHPAVREFSVLISAEGCAIVESGKRQVRDGVDETFLFTLPSSPHFSGRVVAPDGTPVPGAYAALNGNGFSTMVRDGRPQRLNNSPETRTDENGEFSFDPWPGVESVLIVHDSGCAIAPVSALGPDKPPLILQPWGVINGVVLAAGKPSPHQKLALQSWFAFAREGDLFVDVQGETTSDAAGRFRFEKVPAGPLVVARYYNFNRGGIGLVGYSHHQQVTVPAGGVASATIGGNGRIVTGKLSLSRPIPGYEWRDNLQSFIQAGLVAPKYPGDGPAARQYHRDLARFWATTTRYYLQIAPDGTFRIEDVSTGAYVLTVTITEPPQPGVEDPVYRRTLGELTRTVTISDDQTETVDLGSLLIPIR